MNLIRLTRSEIRKLSSSWMAPGIVMGGLAFVVLNVGALLAIDGTDSARESGVDLSAADQVQALLGATSIANVFIVLLGVVMMTTEFRHRTIVSMFLGEPRRVWVMIAKILGAIVAGALAGIAITLVVFALVLPVLGLKGLDPHLGDPQTWRIVIGGVGALALWCPIGVALGALIRNQIAAILIAIGWFLIVENLVLGFFPQLGRYMLTGASSAIGNSGNTDLLAWWGGVLVMIAYVSGLGVAAAFTLRRDVK